MAFTGIRRAAKILGEGGVVAIKQGDKIVYLARRRRRRKHAAFDAGAAAAMDHGHPAPRPGTVSWHFHNREHGRLQHCRGPRTFRGQAMRPYTITHDGRGHVIDTKMAVGHGRGRKPVMFEFTERVGRGWRLESGRPTDRLMVKAAIYRGMAKIFNEGRVPRAAGRTLDELRDNIMRKIKPRAPRTAEKMLRSVEHMRRVHPGAKNIKFVPGGSSAYNFRRNTIQLGSLGADVAGHEAGHAARYHAGHRLPVRTRTYKDFEKELIEEAGATLASTRASGRKVSPRMAASFGSYTEGFNPFDDDWATNRVLLQHILPPRSPKTRYLQNLYLKRLKLNKGPARANIPNPVNTIVDPDVNPRVAQILSDDLKKMMRAQRKISERRIRRYLGPSAEKGARRYVNRQWSQARSNFPMLPGTESYHGRPLPP